MNDEQIKKNIQSLIDDFRTNYQEYKKESEASIETKLIEPLFKHLGWTEKDFKKRERTHREGKRGFADYTFYIGDKIVKCPKCGHEFIIELKCLRCGYKWIPRNLDKKPSVCPNLKCKSPYWDKPRKK